MWVHFGNANTHNIIQVLWFRRKYKIGGLWANRAHKNAALLFDVDFWAFISLVYVLHVLQFLTAVCTLILLLISKVMRVKRVRGIIAGFGDGVIIGSAERCPVTWTEQRFGLQRGSLILFRFSTELFYIFALVVMALPWTL